MRQLGSRFSKTDYGTESKSTIWSVTFVALLICNFLRMMGQSISNTIIPLYAYDLGATAAVVGFVSGAFAITALLVRPFAGPAFDSFSKKNLFIIFGGVMAISAVGYAYVDSVEAIIAVRFLHGVGMGVTAPVGMALVSEILPEEKMGSGIGVYSLSQAVAQAIGPAFGIWSVGVIGYSITFWIVAVFLMLTCIVTWIFVEDVDKGKKHPPYQLKMSRAFSKRAVGMTVVLMLLAISFACTGSFMAIYGNLQGVENIGLYFTVYAVALMVTRPLFGGISDKYGASKVIIPAMGCFALSYVIIAFSNSLPMFLLSAVAGACGFGVCSPLAQAIIFKCVPVSQRGSASNTSYVGMDLGMLIGPFVGGLVIDVSNISLGSEAAAYSAMWLVMIVPIVLSLIVFLAMRGRIRAYQQDAIEQMVAERQAEQPAPESKR